MSYVDDAEQLIRGVNDQLKGDIEQHTGKPLKGGVSKVKGKVNETIGRTKLRNSSW